jgi:hypothetical protein
MGRRLVIVALPIANIALAIRLWERAWLTAARSTLVSSTG